MRKLFCLSAASFFVSSATILFMPLSFSGFSERLASMPHSTNTELMAQNGKYAEMFRMQAEKYQHDFVL